MKLGSLFSRARFFPITFKPFPSYHSHVDLASFYIIEEILKTECAGCILQLFLVRRKLSNFESRMDRSSDSSAGYAALYHILPFVRYKKHGIGSEIQTELKLPGPGITNRNFECEKTSVAFEFGTMQWTNHGYAYNDSHFPSCTPPMRIFVARHHSSFQPGTYTAELTLQKKAKSDLITSKITI